MKHFGLDNQTLEAFQSVFARYPQVEEVLIYGSRALGTHREGSDIDLCMKGRDLSEALRRRVWLELDALNTPYLVDLSVHHLLRDASLLAHVQRAGRCFYRKGAQAVRKAV